MSGESGEKRGDILVSGRIEVCNDAKEVVEYQYEQADADIRADTQTEYEDEISTYYEENEVSEPKADAGFCGI